MNGQNKIILDHLKNHVGITQLEATRKYGILRLSARIFDLRSAGYNISCILHKSEKACGGFGSYAEYRLVEEKA